MRKFKLNTLVWSPRYGDGEVVKSIDRQDTSYKLVVSFQKSSTRLNYTEEGRECASDPFPSLFLRGARIVEDALPAKELKMEDDGVEKENPSELTGSVSGLVLTTAVRRYYSVMQAKAVLDYAMRTGDLTPFFAEIDAMIRFTCSIERTFEELRQHILAEHALAEDAKRATRREIKEIKKSGRSRRHDGDFETLRAEITCLRGHAAALEKSVADIARYADERNKRIADARKRLEQDSDEAYAPGEDGSGPVIEDY